MSKYQDWIDKLRKEKHADPQIVDLLDAYFFGMDNSQADEVLASLKTVSDSWQWSYRYNPLLEPIPKPTDYSDNDRKAIKLALELDRDSSRLGYSLQKIIIEEPEIDHLTPFLEIIEKDWTLREIIEWIDRHLLPLEFSRYMLDNSREQTTRKQTVSTSVIRFLLDRSNEEIADAVKMVRELPEDRPYWRQGGLDHLPWVFFRFNKDRLPELADLWLEEGADLSASAGIAFARSGFPELEERVVGMIERFAPNQAFAISLALHEVTPKKYTDLLWNSCCRCLGEEGGGNMEVTEVLMKEFGVRALEPMMENLGNIFGGYWYFVNRLDQVWQHLGAEGGPFF